MIFLDTHVCGKASTTARVYAISNTREHDKYSKIYSSNDTCYLCFLYPKYLFAPAGLSKYNKIICQNVYLFFCPLPKSMCLK